MSIKSEDTSLEIEQLEDSNTKMESGALPVTKYDVVSIEKIDTPEGMTGNHWHRYIIGQGNGKIEGLKEGTLKEVTVHAENVAEDPNLRSKGKMANHLSRKQNATPPKPPAPATSTS